MFRVRAPYLLLALGIIAPASAFATTHYCIASDGGFGNGGTSYIGINFTVPADGACTAWEGFTKTASTVVLTTGGTGCLSSDGKKLTVSVASADPSFFGSGNTEKDYIELTRPGSTGSFTGGEDTGYFGGSARLQTCTTSLETLPSSHD